MGVRLWRAERGYGGEITDGRDYRGAGLVRGGVRLWRVGARLWRQGAMYGVLDGRGRGGIRTK